MSGEGVLAEHNVEDGLLGQVGRPSYARHVVVKLLGADQW